MTTRHSARSPWTSRAYSDLTVDAFNHENFPGSDNRANCELAAKAADILARRYVPLAGGKPFAGTAQRPDETVLAGLKPCEFVTNPIYTPVIEDNPRTDTTDYGTSCTYQDDHGILRELISTGAGGLDGFPHQLQGGQVTARTFGADYPARQERTDRECILAIETGDGQVFAVDYTHPEPTDQACRIAGVQLASSIAGLLSTESDP